MRLRVPNKFRVDPAVIQAALQLFDDSSNIRMPVLRCNDNGLDMEDLISVTTMRARSTMYTFAAYTFNLNALACLYAATTEIKPVTPDHNYHLISYRKVVIGKRPFFQMNLLLLPTEHMISSPRMLSRPQKIKHCKSREDLA